jgi:hypothetical protein
MRRSEANEVKDALLQLMEAVNRPGFVGGSNS